MTAAQILTLRSEIAADLGFFRRRLDEACAHPAGSGTDVELAYTALAMQRAYTSLEALVERCVLAFDGAVPGGRDGHQALLRRAALPIAGVRPALISPAALATANEFLRFRHFLHHDYGAELDGPLLAKLQETIAGQRATLEGDLARLDPWLVTIAEGLGE